jgi:spore germination cell wall hydrolase CwlJ-like protein
MAATAPALAQPAGAIRLTETPEWAKLEPGMPYRIIEPEIAPVQPFAPAAEQDEGSRARSLECLARTIYYEARSETEDGQRAVAQVVLNRVRHPAYPASVCGVVNQGAHLRTGCQFTFNCDGSLRLAPHGYAWDRARKIAAEALSGVVYGPVGTATHYHTTAILPYWAKSLTRSAVVGAHVFYRWRGRQGAASAFTQRYAGQEPGAGIQLGPISEVPPIALASASTVEAGVRKWSGMPDVRIHRGKAPKEAPTEENLALAASTAEAQPASFGVTVHRGDSSLPTE